MNFASKYFERVNVFDKFINEKPNKKLNFVIVIPVLNEPYLIKTIKKLYENVFQNIYAEILVVINSAENDKKKIIEQNKKSFKDLENFRTFKKHKNLKLNVILKQNIALKKAGAGFARKIGMDEALRRLSFLNKPDGIIVSLDADTLPKKNYIQAINDFFKQNRKIEAANINFEHPLSGTFYSPEIYKAIIVYELYLRYYVQALRYANFPGAYHTVGSAFAVKARAYAKYGGMVTNKSGEDFYFLQKIISKGNFSEIKTTCVQPSPRITDRVVFGTGVAVKNIIKKYNFDYPAYTFKSFELLKDFFSKIEDIYKTNKLCKDLDIHQNLKEYLMENKFDEKIAEIKQNTARENKFKKRFFQWFNSFRVLKYLNYCHSVVYRKESLKEETKKLLKKYKFANIDSEKQMLKILRNIQNKTIF